MSEIHQENAKENTSSAAKFLYNTRPGRKRKGRHWQPGWKPGENEADSRPPVEEQEQELKIEEVESLMETHNTFEVAGFRLDHLPKFDDLVDYDVEQQDVDKFWSMEVERLVGVVNGKCKGMVFEGHGFLEDCSQESYRNLSLLSDQILSILAICIYDNETILKLHCDRLHSSSNYSNCKSTLSRVMDRMTDLDESNSDAFYTLVNYITGVIAYNLSCLPNSGKYRAKCIAVLAKWSAKVKVLSGAPSRNAAVSIHLAERKPLHTSTGIHFAGSARKGGIWHMSNDGFVALPEKRKFLETFGSYQDTMSPAAKVFWEVTMGTEPEHVGEEGVRRSKYTYESNNAVNQYFASEQLPRVHLYPILCFILQALKHYKISGRSPSDFEMCSCVYDIGFEGFGVSVFEDRDGEFLASSDLACLKVSRIAFEVANTLVQNIKDSKPTPDESIGTNHNNLIGKPDPQNKGTVPQPNITTVSNTTEGNTSATPKAEDAQVSWYVGKESTKNIETMKLHKVADVVGVTIPLMMTSPHITIDLVEFYRVMATTMDMDIPGSWNSSDEHSFTAFLSISTSEFLKSKRSNMYEYASPLSKALTDGSDGLLTRDKLLSDILHDIKSRIKQKVSKYVWTRVRPPYEEKRPDDQIKSRRANAESIKKVNAKMDKWIFDEKAIIISCGFYVWSWAMCSLFLVVGGLVIGFSIGNRIKGVDPFNITTYAWVLAAFILLLARNNPVENWPWRDFLRGQVVCRSVSELHTVSGIDEQLIVAKLLHDESTTIISTRGPFNAVFQRRMEEGLSIDVPITLQTLLLSGIIPLKVATRQGSALICMDVRRGKRYTCVLHQSNTIGERDMIVCVAPETPQKSPWEREGQEKKHLLTLQRKNIRWIKILGLYNRSSAQFL